MREYSSLQKARFEYQPKVPPILTTDPACIEIELGSKTTSVANQEDIAQIFPYTYGAPILRFIPAKDRKQSIFRALKVGILLSGGQAPGGHNVITGLFDSMKKINAESRLFGFLGGPQGLVDGKYKELDHDYIESFRNTGGFDMIQSGRTKLEGLEVFEKARQNCQKLGLDALVIVGGDDSNTNAALLAEYFLAQEVCTQVIGCPKTIDGDLKNDCIEISFGFDTACRTYSELISNISRDACSSQKYWHFIRLMGRSASHITLECALQTHPNVCIISEEVAAKKMTIDQVVDSIVSSVLERSKEGMNFGIVLVPEGLIEFIPEINILINELNHLLHNDQELVKIPTIPQKVEWISKHLPSSVQKSYTSLPFDIREQLIQDRDPHGNIQVSVIETEKMLINLVKEKLATLKEQGKYKGKFGAMGHFFGYEGRAAFPTNFDANYCYTLGYAAFILIAHGHTGYMSAVQNLNQSVDKWEAGGIPLTMMMNLETRHGKRKPVIRKALVDLEGKPFKELCKYRSTWAKKNCFLYPGAIQYYGPPEICDCPPITLQIEKS